jgi:hypothetical protein
MMKEREERKWEVARDTTFKGEGQEIFFPPVLKVPRQCSLVLLVEVCLRVSTVFGTLEGLHYCKILT